MNIDRRKEVMSHAEAQFKPLWIALAEQHGRELKEAQLRARQTNNVGAMLPAEADCYISHAKALVIAWAKCAAQAYNSFGEAAGQDADESLSMFFSQIVSARKSAFQGMAQLRATRTRNLTTLTQLHGLLAGFDREASVALLEARAILDRQRVEMINRSDQSRIRYVVDTCVFNWIVDSKISRNMLPLNGTFGITQIQVDEINKTKDEERRARLLLAQASLHCELLPTEFFVEGISRSEYAKESDGRLYASLKAELDKLNGAKKSNGRDALIAEAAIANGHVLLTADADLRSATQMHGGRVTFFGPEGVQGDSGQRVTTSTIPPATASPV
jgi:predicted nucleic acid-binding protein